MATDRYQALGTEAEFEPGSRGRVLRNLAGIRGLRAMQSAESWALLEVQERALTQFGRQHRFTAKDVRWMHRAWLGSLYAWSGEYRQVNLAKGDFMFAAAPQIPVLMAQLERQELQAFTPCCNLDEQALAVALARVHAELILIHPFREGNGRCARLLAMLMALQAGWPPLDFSPMHGRGKRVYIGAVHAAMGRDYGPMEAVFSRVLRRSA